MATVEDLGTEADDIDVEPHAPAVSKPDTLAGLEPDDNHEVNIIFT